MGSTSKSRSTSVRKRVSSSSSSKKKEKEKVKKQTNKNKNKNNKKQKPDTLKPSTLNVAEQTLREESHIEPLEILTAKIQSDTGLPPNVRQSLSQMEQVADRLLQKVAGTAVLQDINISVLSSAAKRVGEQFQQRVSYIIDLLDVASSSILDRGVGELSSLTTKLAGLPKKGLNEIVFAMQKVIDTLRSWGQSIWNFVIGRPVVTCIILSSILWLRSSITDKVARAICRRIQEYPQEVTSSESELQHTIRKMLWETTQGTHLANAWSSVRTGIIWAFSLFQTIPIIGSGIQKLLEFLTETLSECIQNLLEEISTFSTSIFNHMLAIIVDIPYVKRTVDMCITSMKETHVVEIVPVPTTVRIQFDVIFPDSTSMKTFENAFKALQTDQSLGKMYEFIKIDETTTRRNSTYAIFLTDERHFPTVPKFVTWQDRYGGNVIVARVSTIRTEDVESLRYNQLIRLYMSGYNMYDTKQRVPMRFLIALDNTFTLTNNREIHESLCPSRHNEAIKFRTTPISAETISRTNAILNSYDTMTFHEKVRRIHASWFGNELYSGSMLSITSVCMAMDRINQVTQNIPIAAHVTLKMGMFFLPHDVLFILPSQSAHTIRRRLLCDEKEYPFGEIVLRSPIDPAVNMKQLDAVVVKQGTLCLLLPPYLRKQMSNIFLGYSTRLQPLPLPILMGTDSMSEWYISDLDNLDIEHMRETDVPVPASDNTIRQFTRQIEGWKSVQWT